MPFLLILSALLTALTGVVTGVRPADVQIARHAEAAVVVRTVTAAIPATARHAHLLDSFGVIQAFAVSDDIHAPSFAAVRLYLDRLRA